MSNFLSLHEILAIYCISWKIVREILRNYRVDFYKDDELYINIREFHKVYTTKYNPTLFREDELEWKQEERRKLPLENSLNRTFFSMFTLPVDSKKKIKKLSIAYAW